MTVSLNIIKFNSLLYKPRSFLGYVSSTTSAVKTSKLLNRWAKRSKQSPHINRTRALDIDLTDFIFYYTMGYMPHDEAQSIEATTY